jgi:hypothetical protein
MHETELLRRISELEVQNRALIAENERLQEALGLSVKEVARIDAEYDHSLHESTLSQANIIPSDCLTSENPVSETVPEVTDSKINEAHTNLPHINKYSSPKEKIELFMSLFRGREDVYAKRCYSKRYGSSYYIPACRNEWVQGICDRARTKCKDCAHREFMPLTKEIIDTHLRNKDENGVGIVGIYPLLPDETCWFLAVDFDEADWQKDIAAFRTVCEESGISVSIERSRSGNGAHAWIFFEEPVSAVSARKLGNTLLTKAMSTRHEIRFSSYDRMFPNQDFMPKGGFGNLIALPLQGGTRRNGNSEFIDRDFQSYPDQWAYLSSIRKITSEELDEWLGALCVGNGLGELAETESEDEVPKPWERKTPEPTLESRDFPNKLTIVEANRLYIPKIGVSQRALNRIKRLAAFSNPLFYKTQAMRMSTYGIPRIIYSLDECHHVPSVNYERVLSATTARYVYGLTATPARQDG